MNEWTVVYLIGVVVLVGLIRYWVTDLFNDKKLDSRLIQKKRRSKTPHPETKSEEILDGITVLQHPLPYPDEKPKNEDIFNRRILFGNRWIEERVLTSGMLFLGTTETGKTTMLELVLQDALKLVGRTNILTGKPFPHRAIVTDPKGNNVAILAKMKVPYKVLTPLVDSPAVVEWDIAREVYHDWRLVEELIADLYPKRKESEPFWNNAVRSIADLAISSLNRRHREQGISWSFRDFFILMMNCDLIEHFIEKDDFVSRSTFNNFLRSDVAKNVRSSVIAATRKYAVLADAWDGTREKFSVVDWINGHYVLVLPFDTRFRESFGMVYTLILNKVLAYVCSPIIPDTDKIHELEEGEVPSRFYLFLDEIQNLQTIKGLSSTINLGRSKGLSVTLCLQNLDIIQEQYGKEGMGALLAALKTRAVFQVDGMTAEIVEGWLGEIAKRVHVSNVSLQGGLSGGGMSVSQSVNDSLHREVDKVFSRSKLSTIAPAEFKVDPKTREVRGRGISGLYFSQGKWEEASTSAEWIVENAPKKCKKTLTNWRALHQEVSMKKPIRVSEVTRLMPEVDIKVIEKTLRATFVLEKEVIEKEKSGEGLAHEKERVAETVDDIFSPKVSKEETKRKVV